MAAADGVSWRKKVENEIFRFFVSAFRGESAPVADFRFYLL